MNWHESFFTLVHKNVFLPFRGWSTLNARTVFLYLRGIGPPSYIGGNSKCVLPVLSRWGTQPTTSSSTFSSMLPSWCGWDMPLLETSWKCACADPSLAKTGTYTINYVKVLSQPKMSGYWNSGGNSGGGNRGSYGNDGGRGNKDGASGGGRGNGSQQWQQRGGGSQQWNNEPYTRGNSRGGSTANDPLSAISKVVHRTV